MPQRIEATIDEILRADQHGFWCPSQDSPYDMAPTFEEKVALKKKYSALLDHLDRVCQNCRILAKRIIEEATCYEDLDFAHKLIIEGQRHDESKLSGQEWEYLCDYERYKGTPELKEAASYHVKHNSHHPEYILHKNGIHSMGDLNIATLVADWYARGVEFNRPIKQFMEEVAFKKYGFDENSPVYGRICYFYKLLTGEKL